MRKRAAFLILLATVLSACGSSPAAPDDPNMVRVNGTVRFMTFEGGFWAVRGDDDVTYDPINGLPACLPGRGPARPAGGEAAPDACSIHMAGPIVEIITIAKLGT